LDLTAPTNSHRLAVAVETPQYSGLGDPLDYLSERPLTPGTLVRVPLGRRQVLGIVWMPVVAPVGSTRTEPSDGASATPDRPGLRPIIEALDAAAPLPLPWLKLAEFAAGYYQRGCGELALSVLPPELRRLDAAGLAQRLRRLDKRLVRDSTETTQDDADRVPAPTAEQLAALAALEQEAASPEPRPVLLHGVTGSGKTEVYLRATQQALERARQALVLVPEINLTPQLLSRFEARFPAHRIVALHSGLTPVQRLHHWLMALQGHAHIVLGTRMAVFVPLPRLGLVVVDEEHDPSYKQQEGARYSARDLAVYRGHLERVPVVLGSATPSLESWERARQGRYHHVVMADRMGGATLPQVRLFDMGLLTREKHGHPALLAPPVLQALQECLQRGEQSLLFLNRRGYAPVLHCADCGWKSGCPHCSAWRVFHKRERTLRCHHCGLAERVPRACPQCGNLDIAPLGRGTERLEEQLGELLPVARIGRIDADTARGKGQLESRLAQVHEGEVDVLVGTQMVTKGHDFRRITLVVALNPDAALFASDFRAPERLFALLMQAAGRAGRDAATGLRSQMWVQTWHPTHPLYAALKRHDFEAFAQGQLQERQGAGLPPFSHLALLRAEARDVVVATAFLRAAAEAGVGLDDDAGVVVYPPVPPALARVAGIERMQMLVECASRARLQRWLSAWLPRLHVLRAAHKGLARWAIDVDPQAI
jgi:primosomal protein N' (replication factor Y)